MRKILFFIPLALAMATGAFWFSAGNTALAGQKPPSAEKLPDGEQALFALAERSLRQIVRHGDMDAISVLHTSLDAIATELVKRKEQRFSVDGIEQLLTQYRQDSIHLAQTFSPRIREIRLYDTFEHEHENNFLSAVEQIGLYELNTAYSDLAKRRAGYIKEPSDESKNGYLAQSEKVKKIIEELYLDSTVEKPLIAYLENHRLYFETIAVTYEKIGLERVKRVRSNGYAIKAELQLLPVL